MKQAKNRTVRKTSGGGGDITAMPRKRNSRLRPIQNSAVVVAGYRGWAVAVVFFLLFFAVVCNAQKYEWKRAILPASLSFAAGAAWGTNQTLEHRNAAFFRVFPDANKRFWGVDSWKNKYKNFTPENGRNKTPIWITDGKHLTASATQIFVFGAGLSIGIGENRKWWHYAADAGISFVTYSAGNYLTYNQIFK